MTFKRKFILFSLLLICFSFLSFSLSKKVPFVGDETGTLNIKNISKPIPYKLFVSLILDKVEATYENIFKIRATSLFFMGIFFLLWYIYLLKGLREFIIFNFLMLTSSILLVEATYFRYYSYYLMSSTFFLVFQNTLSKTIGLKYKLFFSFIFTILSPYFLFVLNSLQFGAYFIYLFVTEYINSKKFKYLYTFIFLSPFLSIGLFPNIVPRLINFIHFSDDANITNNGILIRGLTKSILIKPFYSIYQMIVGYNISPTESYILLFIVFLIVLFLIMIYFLIYKSNKNKFLTYSISYVLPFIIIFYFFESLSVPGFTQLESKHGFLFFPFLIFLVIKSSKYVKLRSYFIFIIIYISVQSVGLFKTFKNQRVDWRFITNSMKIFLSDNKDINILMDGRSSSDFKFYNNDQIPENIIKYTWEDESSLKKMLTNDKPLVLLLNDYKSYTPLTLKQNWNAGSSSNNRVEGLKRILYQINHRYRLIDSYIRYPTFYYLFEKKKDKNNVSSVGVWKHHLKDVILPLDKPARKVISSILISPNDSLFINFNEKLVVNLEGDTRLIKNGESVGFFEVNNQKFKFTYGENIWGIFSEYYNLPYSKEKVFHDWDHRPLISGSINYPGSYFNHKANIYFIDINIIEPTKILIKNQSNAHSIRVWI
jgi:hypothetical protein